MLSRVNVIACKHMLTIPIYSNVVNTLKSAFLPKHFPTLWQYNERQRGENNTYPTWHKGVNKLIFNGAVFDMVVKNIGQ